MFTSLLDLSNDSNPGAAASSAKFTYCLVGFGSATLGGCSFSNQSDRSVAGLERGKLTRRLCLHNVYFPELDSICQVVEQQFDRWSDGSRTLKKLCAIA
jgi:hypothetical protein